MSEGAPSGTVRVRAWPDEERAERAPINVSDGERVLSAVAGGLLMISGVRRLSLSGLVLTALGGALAYRAASGHCAAYERLGIDNSANQNGSVSETQPTQNSDESYSGSNR
ncbi:MAG: YgaP family membrane protein [Gammaproteobacteria bacterium]